ncbi:hypothetical protein phiOC_p157 [Ochrobactrum phage vB_OspM_OC]|nr:hypothetical protein phiOC_p157 [Ochrobactrum phage vB_OspM_OC]
MYENPYKTNYDDLEQRAKLGYFRNAVTLIHDVRKASYQFDDFLSENFFCDWASDGESSLYRYDKNDHFERFRDSSIKKLYRYDNSDVMLHHWKLLDGVKFVMRTNTSHYIFHTMMYSYYTNALMAKNQSYLIFFMNNKYVDFCGEL